jgi:hypothetical protein
MMFYWFANQCGFFVLLPGPCTPPIPIWCFVFALDFVVSRVDKSSAGLGAGEPFTQWIARYCAKQLR